MVTFKDLVANKPEFERQRRESIEKLREQAKSISEDELLQSFYGFVGFYISTFQSIESKIDEIILLSVGHDRWHIGQSVVSSISNREKIELLNSIVVSSAISDGGSFRQKCIQTFTKLIERLKDEGSRRNKIVHSTYLYDFMKIGAPPLRSKRKKRKGKIGFDQEYFDLVSMNLISGEILELEIDVGLMKTQLLHWSDDLIRPASAKQKSNA